MMNFDKPHRNTIFMGVAGETDTYLLIKNTTHPQKMDDTDTTYHKIPKSNYIEVTAYCENMTSLNNFLALSSNSMKSKSKATLNFTHGLFGDDISYGMDAVSIEYSKIIDNHIRIIIHYMGDVKYINKNNHE